jgi:hypothetical protein
LVTSGEEWRRGWEESGRGSLVWRHSILELSFLVAGPSRPAEGRGERERLEAEAISNNKKLTWKLLSSSCWKRPKAPAPAAVVFGERKLS